MSSSIARVVVQGRWHQSNSDRLNRCLAQARRLVRELADATGESLTDAVRNAVRERLERLRNDFDPAEVLELVQELRNTSTEIDVDQSGG